MDAAGRLADGRRKLALALLAIAAALLWRLSPVSRS
jgi:hypothetical protein